MNRSIPPTVVKFALVGAGVLFAIAMMLEWVFPAVFVSHPVWANFISAAIGFGTAIVFASWIIRWYREAERREELSRQCYAMVTPSILGLRAVWEKILAPSVCSRADQEQIIFMLTSDLYVPQNISLGASRVDVTTRPYRKGLLGYPSEYPAEDEVGPDELRAFRLAAAEHFRTIRQLMDDRDLAEQGFRRFLGELDSRLDTMPGSLQEADAPDAYGQLIWQIEELRWALDGCIMRYAKAQVRLERGLAKERQTQAGTPETIVPGKVIRRAFVLLIVLLPAALWLDYRSADMLGRHPVLTNLLSAAVCFSIAILIFEWGFRR